VNVIPETDRLAPRLARLRDEFDMAKSALGAAQFERNAIAGDDPHTIAVLDVRVAQAQEALAAAVEALTGAEAELTDAQTREQKRNHDAN